MEPCKSDPGLSSRTPHSFNSLKKKSEFESILETELNRGYDHRRSDSWQLSRAFFKPNPAILVEISQFFL